MFIHLAAPLTVSTVPRRGILYTCNHCPTSDRNQFDHLKNAGGHDSTRSLEGHVKRAHSEHAGDSKDYKGEPVYKYRMVNRRLSKTAVKGSTIEELAHEEDTEESDEAKLSRLTKMADELEKVIEKLRKTTRRPLAKKMKVQRDSSSEEGDTDKAGEEDADNE